MKKSELKQLIKEVILNELSPETQILAKAAVEDKYTPGKAKKLYPNITGVTGTMEDLNDLLFKKLVPRNGNADTLEGEILRAMNKVAYRYWNDGDIYNKGYGRETVNPAMNFLKKYKNLVPGLAEAMKTSGTYKSMLDKMTKAVVKYVNDRVNVKKETTPNTDDMLKY